MASKVGSQNWITYWLKQFKREICNPEGCDLWDECRGIDPEFCDYWENFKRAAKRRVRETARASPLLEDEKTKEIIMLFEQGLKSHEIAEKVGTSKRTVWRRISDYLKTVPNKN